MTILIGALGDAMGQPGLNLDENGMCTLRNDEGREFRIMVPADSSAVYLSALIGDLPDDASLERVYAWLLQRNFLLLDTDGASFSIDDEARFAVLCYSKPFMQMEPLEFLNLLGGFFESAERLTREYHEFLTSGAEVDREKATKASDLDAFMKFSRS